MVRYHAKPSQADRQEISVTKLIELFEHLVTKNDYDYADRAKQTGAFKRARGFKDVKELLRLLLGIGSSGNPLSQFWRQKSMDFCDIGYSALRERLQKSYVWINGLLSMVLGIPTKPRKTLKQDLYVNLLDASTVPGQGKKCQSMVIHCDWNLSKCRMQEITIGPNTVGEGFKNFSCDRRYLIVGDRGYGYRANIIQALESGAQVLLRFSPSAIPLEDAQGNPFNCMEKLSALPKDQEYVRFDSLYFLAPKGGKKAPKYPVSIIAQRATPEVLKARREKTVRTAARKERKVQSQTLKSAQWLLLITTLDSEWEANELVSLYRARWQIELIFKQLKQRLNLHVIRSSTPEIALSILLCQFLYWALVEVMSSIMEEFLVEEYLTPDMCLRLSHWKLRDVALKIVEAMIFRHPLQVDDVFRRNIRHVVNSPRKRILQLATFLYGSS